MSKKKTQPVQHIFVVPSNIPPGPDLVDWCKKAIIPVGASGKNKEKWENLSEEIFSRFELVESRPWINQDGTPSNYTRHVFSRVQK